MNHSLAAIDHHDEFSQSITWTLSMLLRCERESDARALHDVADSYHKRGDLFFLLFSRCSLCRASSHRRRALRERRRKGKPACMCPRPRRRAHRTEVVSLQSVCVLAASRRLWKKPCNPASFEFPGAEKVSSIFIQIQNSQRRSC